MRIKSLILTLSLAGLATPVSLNQPTEISPRQDNSNHQQMALQCLNTKKEIIGSTVICYFDCNGKTLTQTLQFPANCPLYINV